MKSKADWRLRLIKVKADVAQSLKKDYLAGKTIPELMKAYQMSKRVIYLWLVPSDEEKEAHVNKVKELKKFGPPRGKRKPKNKILEKPEY